MTRPVNTPLAVQKRLSRKLDRLEVATALELTGGVDERDLATLLRSNSPEDSCCRIDTLARKLGISYSRVIEAYKNMKRLEGIVAIAERLPSVMEGIAVDAESREVACEACDGTGQVVIPIAKPPALDGTAALPEYKTCIPCAGTGRVVRSGDPVARKQVLEIMELAGQTRSPIIAPGSNILVSNQSLEETLRAARASKPSAQAEPTTLEGE